MHNGMRFIIFQAVCYCLAQVSYCSVSDLTDASKFLDTYGYIKLKPNRMIDQKVLIDGIKKYQHFMGIPVSGTLCNATKSMMNMPRCGFKDIYDVANKSGKYVALSRWETKNLKYRIKNYPSYLSKNEVEYTIQAAFDIWSEHTDLTFTPIKSGNAHINIGFGQIDGPSGVLAYAYFPPGGDATFDSSETWKINGYNGFNLLQVAAHEFGHSLGLDHSKVYEALMWPNYKSGNLQLARDDIKGIQYLYGNKNHYTTTKKPFTQKPTKPRVPVDGTTTSPRENVPNICVDSSIDAALKIMNETFFFKGDYYWKIVNYRPDRGYPKRIQNRWKELPGNIDAALQDIDMTVYFFKSNICWKYDRNNDLMHGYPKQIRNVFTGIPDNLDAAMTWKNDDLYFFKGNMYWKYNTRTQKTYDYHINNLIGIPANVNAALKHDNGHTYFFKGNGYYRFNEDSSSVDYPYYSPYPRQTNQWWFGCTKNGLDYINGWNLMNYWKAA